MNELDNTFLKTYRKKLIKEFSKSILRNFQVTNMNGLLVDQEEIIKSLYNFKVSKRCIGITSSSNVSQCTRNAIEDRDYCKTHMYKIGLVKEEITVSINHISNSKLNDCSKLKKKFINDSFYYVNDKFIYNIDTNEKVGYIFQSEYILTSDPFILDEYI